MHAILHPTLFAAAEAAAKDAVTKARAVIPELEAAKEAAAKEREGALAQRASLAKESAARQTTLDRLRHERRDLLGRVQTSQLSLPMKKGGASDPDAAGGGGSRRGADKHGSRKGGGSAAAAARKAAADAADDEDVDMAPDVGGSLDADAAEDADDRRIALIDFSKLTLDTDDVSPQCVRLHA